MATSELIADWRISDRLRWISSPNVNAFKHTIQAADNGFNFVNSSGLQGRGFESQ